jgi:hypothetical protein
MSDTSENAPPADIAAASDIDVPAGAAGALVVPLDFTIHVPDLRNGDVALIQQAAPKASVAEEYKWAHIAGMQASDAVNLVEYLIRGTYAHICARNPGDSTDQARAEIRKKAIVLGAVRAGAAAANSITPQDMNASEVTNGGYSFNSGRIGPTTGAGTAAGKYTVASGMTALTALEIKVVGILVYMGMAVPALQGASLVNSGHHYLPTTANIFAGLRRQTLGLGQEDVKAWIGALGETFDDLAFHKACHPISPPVKRRWAKSQTLPARLMAAGHGAAAIRLPAIPSDAQTGKTAVALMMRAKPVIHQMGHTMELVQGPQLLENLGGASEGMPEREAVSALQAWAAAHATNIAFCAGIVQAVHQASGTGRNTLLSAYSVRKVMGEHPDRVQMGETYARAANTRAREAMAAGNFADVMIRA